MTSSSPTRTTRSSPSSTGSRIDIVKPSGTILIENPIAITTETKHPKQAQAFLDFLYSKQGQEIFADNGYRPVVSGVTSSKVTFSTPPGLFTINDLGGWTDVTNTFFDATKGIVTKIEQSNGVSTTSKRVSA